MATNKGIEDNDKGMNDILKEYDSLKKMILKVGIPEESGEQDGVSIAQYASWNELGVMRKDKSGWYIPPRPFIRTTLDTKREKIAQAIDKNIGGLAQGGEADAKTALARVGEAVAGLIKQTIRECPWEKNLDVTINGTQAVVVGKETKVSKKSGKAYTKNIKKQFIKGKKSNKPLIDTGTMRNSIQYVIELNGTEIAELVK
ncbi:MAG: hypothetical protein Pg6C_06450 [Treponemataceae bacterium]|nr:MAG: hypothetical protein Pg6C_06450 [Treponemataceae bacterium]